MKKENKDPAPSQEYLEKKELLKIELNLEKSKHKMRMDELEKMREVEEEKHLKTLERERIKSAEVKKMQERKFFGR